MLKPFSTVIRSRGRGKRGQGEGEVLNLSVRDSQAFAKALLHRRPVNARLRETVRRYRAATRV